MSETHTCGTCLFLHDGRCAFYGRDPKGSPWRYADWPRRADHLACIHFEPHELPACFHIGGVAPPCDLAAPIPAPFGYEQATGADIEAMIEATRLAAKDQPYSPDQAREIRGLLKRMGKATQATDDQVEAAFERIRRAADIAREALQTQFWSGLDPTPEYDLRTELKRVAVAGVVGPRARATLFGALLLALEWTGTPTPPLQELRQVFDDDAAHPQEAFIRAIPPAQLQRAVIALLRDKRGLLPKRGRPPGSATRHVIIEIVSVFQSISGRNGAPFSRQSGSRQEGKILKHPSGTPRGPLVDLIAVALQPVESLSRHSIGDILKRSF